MLLETYYERDAENPWRGSFKCVTGVVAGVNYGRSQDEDRNYWYYHVVWANESWEIERPDGKLAKMSFTSEAGALGWPHFWRHDLLTAMRGLPTS